MRFSQLMRYRLTKPKQLSFSDYTDRFADATVEYLLNFSSNVIKITDGGKHYYFKEAKPHSPSLRTRVFESISAFFEDVVHNPELEVKVTEALKERANLRKLINIGNKSNPRDNFHRYLVTGDPSHLGLPSPRDDSEGAQQRKLVFYLYGEIQNWTYNVSLKTGELETFGAVRALATQELSRLIGVDYLISYCEAVKLKLYGKLMYGILSEEAEGDTLTSYPCYQRMRHITPELVKSLTDLNLLDAITNDNDHRVGNYHVISNDSGDYVTVRSFDNDGPHAFGLSADLRSPNLIGCSGFINKRGLVNRAHLGEETASALYGMDDSAIKSLGRYLGNLELWFLGVRIRKLKRAIRKTAAQRSDFLISHGGWLAKHIEEELSPGWGKTYLASLLSDCYYKDGLHDFDTLQEG